MSPAVARSAKDGPPLLNAFAVLMSADDLESLQETVFWLLVLNDVIKSNTAAARPKDLDALPELLRIAGRDRHQDRDLDHGLDL
jgi:hypothetical protein